MIKSLFKVVSQTEPTTINTKNGQTQKSTVVLQETGDQFADSYVASLIGNQQLTAVRDEDHARDQFMRRAAQEHHLPMERQPSDRKAGRHFREADEMIGLKTNGRSQANGYPVTAVTPVTPHVDFLSYKG